MRRVRRTKIVCTLGPASDPPEVLRGMVRAGMDVARLNFSHGNRSEHARRVQAVRDAAKAEGKVLGVLLDIQGPKIRVGDLPSPVALPPGTRVRLAPEARCPPGAIPVTHETLAKDVQRGSTLLLDDGNLELRVTGTDGEQVEAEVVVGGVLKAHKSLNMPGAKLTLPALSSKDLEDVRFGLQLDVDLVAASFVRTTEDVAKVKALLLREELPPLLISKIERPEALDNLDAILRASDGVLVARGDMGVELPPEEVPLVQKDLIRRCNVAGLPVITATQMLESMMHAPRPTRAEASDVANAVWDGTDAVMLSGETAAGQYPVRAVEVMDRIVRRAEEAHLQQGARGRALAKPTVQDAIAHAACTTAEQLGSAAVVALTNSGSTARLVSKYRPTVPILGVTPIPRTAGQLQLMWGVLPLLVPRALREDQLLDACLAEGRERGWVRPGQTVVVTSGRLGVTGTTDHLRVVGVS
ncbi:MAG: pyruvate kinase [Halobacteriales archaeon]|nr:pyruvate kinase [Halobacteriales archaeon]